MTAASPEAQAPPQPERQADTSFLSLNNIEALRQQQHDMLYETLDDRNAYTADEVETVQAEVIDQYERQCIEYLAAHGIDENHPRFQEYCSIIRSYSYDRMSDQEWYAGTENQDGTLGPSGMDKLRETRERIEQRGDTTNAPDSDAAANATTATGEPDSAGNPEGGSIDTDPEAEGSHDFSGQQAEDPVHHNLTDRRAALALLAAKRQGKLFGKGGRKYNDAHDEYAAAVNEVGRHEESLRSSANPNRTQEEKNRDVIAFILEEQGKLRAQTVENLRGTKVGRFIEAMNKGGKAARFFKGAALGVGVGLVGSALIATGAGVLAGVATAGVMGTRFARGFAAADAQNGRGMPAEADEAARTNLENRASDPGFTVEDGNHEVMDSFEHDTKQEQKKRRKAAAWGMGGIVVGSLVGEAITLAARDWDPNVPGWLGGPDIDVDVPDGDIDVNGPNGDVDVDGPVGDGDGTGGETPGDGDADPDTVPDGTPAGTEYTFGESADAIHTGEGWYETFQEMGIPADQRAELLQAVGPQLQQMGVAYPMGEHSWGIIRPGDMPDEALRVIADAARQHGIVSNSTYTFAA